MNVLVFNVGSSSIKTALYEIKVKPKLLGFITLEWKGDFQSPKIVKENEKKPLKEKNMRGALEVLLAFYKDKQINAFSHRIVHGGKFRESKVITKSVRDQILKAAKFAPLHNEKEVEVIDLLKKMHPQKPQVAVFDTAFHKTIPKKAYLYPIPLRWSQKGIIRYGFHGTSYQFISRIVKEKKVIVCHLGSGASLCALQNGKSIDTTMGMTPLEGLMMDTRSGSIDPGILLYLLKEKKMKIEELSEALYKKSGLLGASGISSDMRDLLKAKNKNAKLALDIYVHILCKSIGSMIASLKGLDSLVFTAGIGENSSYIRKKVIENFSFLGVEVDPQKNRENEKLISTKSSKIKVYVLKTDESLEIARQCYLLLKKR